MKQIQTVALSPLPPSLGYFGFGSGLPLSAAASEQIEICQQWLETNAQPANGFRADSYSYKLKHLIERDAGTYISNGCAIAAAILLGYRHRCDGSLNCTFAMKLRESR